MTTTKPMSVFVCHGLRTQSFRQCYQIEISVVNRQAYF